MPSPGHERLSAIFLEACELSPADRRAFLDEACAGDLALRAEVESLLVHDGSEVVRLETGAALVEASKQSSAVPERIGPYWIRETLGRH